MFKLIVKSGEKKIVYKPLSIVYKYIFDDGKLSTGLKNLERIFNMKFSELDKKNFVFEKFERLRISNPKTKPDELIIRKVKKDEKFNVEIFRNDLASFINELKNENPKYLHIFIPSIRNVREYFKDEEYYYQTFIEGVYYGNYSFDRYKSDKKKLRELNVLFYADDLKKLKSAIIKARNTMEGVVFARDLQNEPGNNLTPQKFANRLKELKNTGIRVRVFSEDEIKRMKMGGLIAVGQGSVNKPRFIVLEYKSGKKKSKRLKKIALVGKGITFDSGGISIKPSANMGEMKGDMSGAAVVAGTVLAAAKNNLPVHLYGIIPSAENMPSGESFRPGDIIKTASGKSVEVDDTDAEGRVVLADGLHYASKLKVDEIIDLATLTGAVVVALGEIAAGLFTHNDKLAGDLYQSGMKTYDRVWRLPLWADYHELNKSEVADVKNDGGRWGGAISAAKFLENFVDKNIPWAHIDIAGPAFKNPSNNYSKKYMTGFGVRLLVDYLVKNSKV
ncbi:MAG: leucyl aminopeptidase [Ignavibacteriaceae bacterium]|nr:leucyl aminopeptidase [Ignavibacteriaceae bacterium]